MLFLGCDGGSTKYAYVLCDEAGRVLAHRTFPGINVLEQGEAAFAAALATQVQTVLAGAGLTTAQLTHCAFGLSGYGETKTSAADMAAAAYAALGHSRFTLANDSVVGWSGALRCRPGIVVASGTGSVAYGEDGHGGAARGGGWSILYGDEGSSYWVAIRALNLFFRQADGRAPRTGLYDWFLARFDVTDPQYLPREFHRQMRQDVSSIAAFQREVLALAAQGDPQVTQLYADAARELAALAVGIYRRLGFDEGPVTVSYTGGLFAVGAVLTQPFAAEVAKLGWRLVPPAFGPAVGAVCYAARAVLDVVSLDALFDTVGAALEPKPSQQ